MCVSDKASKKDKLVGILVQLFGIFGCIFRSSSCVHLNYGEYCGERYIN